MNLSYICQYSLFKAALRSSSAHFDAHTMVYALTNLIGSKIFNVDKFVNNLDAKAFLYDNSTLLCNCTGSLFVNENQS